MSTQSYDLAVIAQACAASDPGNGGKGLASRLGGLWPELAFEAALTRGGWYRSGGVVDIDKRRVADSIRTWAEQLASDDPAELMAHCLQTALFATRIVGKTHYLTASTGPAAADFVQLEVEELQEVLERYLSDPDWLPDSVEEFIDPLDYPQLEPEPVGTARLVFRRLFAARDLLGALAPRRDGLPRFLRDWDQSSAAKAGHFCKHWVLGVRETTEADGEPHLSARPVSTRAVERLTPNGGLRGAALAHLIQGFDRDAGYSMAWFFHMAAAAGVPAAVGAQVAADHAGEFSYLPARDLIVVRNWVASPYRA